MKKFFFIFFILLGGGLSSAHSLAQTTVYLRPPEALKLLFKSSKEVVQEDHALLPYQRESFRRLLGYEAPKNAYSFYLGKTGTQRDGYALIDEEVGKVMPITFITKISTEGKVDQVEIMVYRESHGGEVASKRFLNQFREKSLLEELRLHKNIVNVTGATLSSQALVKGVKRALALWQIFYGKS